ncbi:hypothetical protein [Enterobacter cancerogenus]|uniref:hypothetical protein n=1 Tax=Enterobacter cancerogenus TaxID=69218 RepID=UPI0034D1EADF
MMMTSMTARWLKRRHDNKKAGWRLRLTRPTVHGFVGPVSALTKFTAPRRFIMMMISLTARWLKRRHDNKKAGWRLRLTRPAVHGFVGPVSALTKFTAPCRFIMMLTSMTARWLKRRHDN